MPRSLGVSSETILFKNALLVEALDFKCWSESRPFFQLKSHDRRRVLGIGIVFISSALLRTRVRRSGIPLKFKLLTKTLMSCEIHCAHFYFPIKLFYALPIQVLSSYNDGAMGHRILLISICVSRSWTWSLILSTCRLSQLWLESIDLEYLDEAKPKTIEEDAYLATLILKAIHS